MYALGLRKETNTEGLRIYVGGQPLSNEIVFRHFPYGSFKVVVEVYRGPHMYDYSNNPVTLYWGTACQDDIIVKTIDLKPVFLKECGKAEFHSSLQSFTLALEQYVIVECRRLPSLSDLDDLSFAGRLFWTSAHTTPRTT